MVEGFVACFLSLGAGFALRNSICSEVDGITVRRLATYITFPCLILQVFKIGAWSLTVSQCALAIVLYTVATILPSILTWATTRFLHPKERGVLAGMSLGSSMDLFAVPVVWLCMSSDALQVACLCSLLNVVVTHVLAPLYFSTAGPAFPKDFKHTDGGLYNGEWKGALKDGFGVYTYPSGAKYEGEWLDGTKEGRGVYTFAKGGIYEGEWRNGKMDGVGVRTYSSGKVSSGLWKDGSLIKAFDESQCSLVVANANEAALVARRVFVGPIEMDEILRTVAAQPAVWAFLGSIGLLLSGMSLTPGLDYVSLQLSKAHAPLALASLGLLFDTKEIEQRQMETVTRTISLRILPGLCIYLIAAFTLPMGLISIPVIAALVLSTVSPMTSRSLELTHIFRLNENLVAATSRYSMYIATACASVFLIATHQALRDNSITPLASAMGLTAVFIWFLATYSSNGGTSSSESNFYARTVKMVYKGPNRRSNDDTRDVGTAALPCPTTTRTYPRTPRMLGRTRPVFLMSQQHYTMAPIRRLVIV